MNSNAKVIDELIICTKDRPLPLLQALHSLELQTHLPYRILVIDASVSIATANAIDVFKTASILNIVYFATEAGLTRQRNFGLDQLLKETKIVHFIDDDVVLDSRYLEMILTGFMRHPKAVGIGGLDTNLPFHRSRLLLRIAKMDSHKQGTVLKTGLNVLNSSGTVDREVQWVSGCSMSFCADIFQFVRFDERRIGNGIGEDVDFCLRAQKWGSIMWIPSVKLSHFKSQINRLAVAESRIAVYRHRMMLAEDDLGGVNRNYVRFAELFNSCLTILKRLGSRDFAGIRDEVTLIRRLCG